VVILTSNLGADLILGSAAGAEAVRGPVLTLARAVLRAELVNRVDEVVLFDPLSPAALATITGMALGETRGRLAGQGVGLVVSEAAVAWLAGRADRPELGARPLRRIVGREVDRRLSRMLLAGEVRPGDEVRVDVGGDPGAEVAGGAASGLVFVVAGRAGGAADGTGADGAGAHGAGADGAGADGGDGTSGGGG
jgi:ATP-dependent Clp protease ATP-binding subunit ClpC